MQMNMKWADWMDWPKFETGGMFGIRRKKTFTEKAVDAVQDFYETAFDTVAPVLTTPAKLASVVTPVMVKPAATASKVWSKTADATSTGLESASDAAGAVAASSAAAAGAVGGFLGGIFSFVWWLVTFAFKAALLVGVAYAGWQWLQSRNNSSRWNSSPSWAGSAGSSGAGYTSTYGSVSPAPASAAA